MVIVVWATAAAGTSARARRRAGRNRPCRDRDMNGKSIGNTPCWIDPPGQMPGPTWRPRAVLRMDGAARSPTGYLALLEPKPDSDRCSRPKDFFETLVSNQFSSLFASRKPIATEACEFARILNKPLLRWICEVVPALAAGTFFSTRRPCCRAAIGSRFPRLDEATR